MLHRLLKPRTPDDCPACRLASTVTSVGGQASTLGGSSAAFHLAQGTHKRGNTEGYACPNQQCTYFGKTDARVHALVGDGKHGRVEQIQTFRCQACHATFSARRDTPLYRLKTPSPRSPWCSRRWPKGWTLRRPRGSSAYDKPRSPAG